MTVKLRDSNYWGKDHPAHVVQMLVTDKNNRFLLMHRSNNVSSARNCWSIPSGTHELGEDIFECIERELQEEYGLVARKAAHITTYENIAGDEDSSKQFHWVISLYRVLVDDVTVAINKEPEKHDKMEFHPVEDFTDFNFLYTHQFHYSLRMYLVKYLSELRTRISSQLFYFSK
jgi:8-oxo-dGTP pyrophosphatase MutT (NUDIX family)